MGELYKETVAYVSFLGFVLFFAGCSPDCDSVEEDSKSPGVYINSNVVKSIYELKPSDPVLCVNGEAVTKKDFLAHLVLKDKIWRIREKLPLNVEQSEMDDFMFQAGDSLLLELIHRTIFRQYAKEISIEPSPEKVDEYGKKLLDAIRMSGSSVGDIANYIGGDAGEIFRKIPYYDAQDAMLRQTVTTNDLDNVTERELELRREQVKRFDANAEKMNNIAKERLLAAKKRILAGSDIVDEAKKIPDTVHPEYAVKWGRFEIQEFPADEAIHNWLLTAKPGDISDPMDTEDGIAIIKVVEKGKGEAPPGVEPPPAFTLVRCTVKACEKMRYQDPQQMRAQLLLWKRQDAQRILGTMLTERAVIEYPNGTNLFIKAFINSTGDEK